MLRGSRRGALRARLSPFPDPEARFSCGRRGSDVNGPKSIIVIRKMGIEMTTWHERPRYRWLLAVLWSSGPRRVLSFGRRGMFEETSVQNGPKGWVNGER